MGLVLNGVLAIEVLKVVHKAGEAITVGCLASACELLAFAVFSSLARRRQEAVARRRSGSLWVIVAVGIGIVLAEAVPDTLPTVGLEAVAFGAALALIVWAPKFDRR